MARRGVVAGAGVILVLAAAGGAYALAVRQGQVEVARAAEQLRQQLGLNGSFTYDGSTIHPLSRAAELDHVVLREADGTVLTADRLSVAPGPAGRLRSVRGSTIALSQGALSLRAASLSASGIAFSAATSAAAAMTTDPAAVTVDRLELRDASATAPGERIDAGTVTIADYGLGRKSTVSLGSATATLSEPVPASTMTVGSARLSGLDLAALVEAAEHHHQPAPQSGPLEMVADALSLNRNNKTVLSIDEVRVQGLMGADRPTWSKVTITGATSTPVDARSIGALQAIGLDAVHWTMSIATDDTPATHRARLGNLSITARDLGELDLGLDLANVDLVALQQASAQGRSALLALLSTVQLANGRLRLADNGLLQRVFAARGRPLNLSADQMRQMTLGMLRDSPQFAALLPDPAMRQAIQQFLADGGALSFKLAPPSPLPIAQLGTVAGTLRSDPGGAIGQLGLSIDWKPAGSASSF